MTFSFFAVWGPCFSFVYAQVLFKHSNLQKGTPVIDYRLCICGVGGQGEWPLGCNPGTSSMETAWLLMGNLWVVQSTSWWHLLTHVSLTIDFSQWNISLLSLFQCFATCLHNSGNWSHNFINKFKAGWIWFARGLFGIFDILTEPALGCWEKMCETMKTRLNTKDFRKQGLVLCVIMSLFVLKWNVTSFTVNIMLLKSPQAWGSESKQDGAKLTTSEPSHQNVSNLYHKNSNHLTSVVFLLQALLPWNNLTSLSTNSPEYLWCVISEEWEIPFSSTRKWPWISSFSLG